MRTRCRLLSGSWMVLMTCGLILAGRAALAHPMGNFSISHYSRLTADRTTLHLRYALDFAEVAAIENLDTNGDGKISAGERETYLQANATKLRDNLTLTIHGKPVPLQLVARTIAARPGAGGLDTVLLTLDLTAPLPDTSASTANLHYRDGNFPARTGWKEIVALPGDGMRLEGSSAASVDQSQELTVYPTDLSTVAPQQTEATFTVLTASAGTGIASAPSSPRVSPVSDSHTPQDAFTQSIATKTLTLPVILFSLGLAFVFGAFHALSPGHGKTMVAAYLVGQRGTAQHAVFLGAVVTVTHTIAVFALGLLTLFASRYVVPERLYPVLSALSGVAIVLVGVSLLRQRIAALHHASAHSHHSHSHDHDHTHSHPHPHDHAHPHTHEPELAHSHSHHDHAHDRELVHAHSHDHTHPHSHGHTHTQDHAHSPSQEHSCEPEPHSHHHHDHEPPHSHPLGWHDHGDGHFHTHAPPEDMPVSMKTLLVLGITGGAMPCPSALVVMLSAIALNRTAFGLLLITSFSLGLAVVLTAIGLLVVYARKWLERLPASGAITTRLSVFSAAVVTLIGVVLVARAVMGQSF